MRCVDASFGKSTTAPWPPTRMHVRMRTNVQPSNGQTQYKIVPTCYHDSLLSSPGMYTALKRETSSTCDVCSDFVSAAIASAAAAWNPSYQAAAQAPLSHTGPDGTSWGQCALASKRTVAQKLFCALRKEPAIWCRPCCSVLLSIRVQHRALVRQQMCVADGCAC